MFHSFTILLSVSALFSYVNHKWLKLPTTIGLMIMAMVLSIPIGLLEVYNPEVFHQACQVVVQINFKTFLLDVILSLLLFAGALHVRIRDLAQERAPVLGFATAGVLISTFIIGFALFYSLQWIGHPIPLVYTLLFGALISPTDPIAVLAILKASNVARSLETKIAGESLFNDGVGVVVFVSILGFTGDMAHVGVVEIASLFAEEALGGIAYGFALGYIGYLLLRSITDDPKVEVLLSLALVLGGYAFAAFIHVSGPLAMVVAGLFIGNKLNSKTFDHESQTHLNLFWEILDEILNSLLFVLIGLEILTLSFEQYYFLVGAISIVITLIARWLSVAATYSVIGYRTDKNPKKTILLLAWGGLRGAISVALALSIDDFEQRELLVFVTYCIVAFSIIVQGLSIKTLVNKLKLSKQ